MALPAGRYGVTKNQLLKIKKLPMNTIKLIEELTEKFDLLGTAAFKNSTSVVTESSDLVESGAVYTALKSKADNSVIGTVEDGTNPTKSYAVGEHFIRGGKFCTCIVPVTTASTWSDSYYVEGDVASELAYKGVTISNPATGVTISGVNAYQYGKIVNFGCILTLANNISAGTALAKISVKCKGFRLFPLYDRSTYVPVNKTVYISSADGSIVTEQALDAGEYRVYGTYFENV